MERNVSTGRAVLCALAGLLVLGAAEHAAAQSRSALMAVRLVVVRSCAVNTGPGAGAPNLTVTCSRGATPSVVPGTASASIPAMTERTVVERPAQVIEAAPVTLALSSQTAAAGEPAVQPAAPVSFELITINF